MASTITLYHYTSEEGAAGIRSEQCIRQSSNTQTDAKYGTGVYLTSISPEDSSKSTIAKNNYDDQSQFQVRKVKEGYLDYVVEVVLNRDEVEEVRSKRDIYLYRGDLDLRGRKFSIKKVE